jgi:hypothetical protein
MSQFQLEIFEEPTGKDFRSLVDASPQRADPSVVFLVVMYNSSFCYTLLISLKKKETNYQRHNFVRIQFYNIVLSSQK